MRPRCYLSSLLRVAHVQYKKMAAGNKVKFELKIQTSTSINLKLEFSVVALEDVGKSPDLFI